MGGFLGRGRRLEYLHAGDHPTSLRQERMIIFSCLRRLESSQSEGLSPS